MKLTKKGEYALKALVQMTIDHDRGNPMTLVNDVARRKGIPQKYLEQILLSLKRAGILVSKRGVGGGYSLSRAAEDISLGEIIRAVEGTLSPVNCVSVSGSANIPCPEASTCGLLPTILEVKNAVDGIMDGTSLKDVTVRTLSLLNRQNNVVDYAI